MPGRQRIQITARGSAASAASLFGRLTAALAPLQIHATEHPLSQGVDPEAGPDTPTNRRRLVAVDVRMQRAQDASEAHAAIRGANNAIADLDFAMQVHECFHGLEDEPDANPCTHTLTWIRVVDGTEQQRGRPNGR